MGETIKAKEGKLYLKTPEGLELIGETGHELDVTLEPNEKYLPALFSQLAEVCKHHHFSYDENKQIIDTCGHPNNQPRGCSWGECRLGVCPVWGKEEKR